MNRIKKGLSKISRQSLLRLWILSFLCFCIWSISWAIMTYFALLDDGISPDLVEYALTYIDHRYITTTTLMFLFSGIIPTLILLFSNKDILTNFAKGLWAAQIIGISLYAIWSKAMFFYG